MDILIRLLLAHILGDFLLQTKKGVRDKMDKGIRSIYLYLHIFIHALLLAVIFQFNFEYWVGFVIIITSHYLIDIFKIKLTGKFNPRFLFFGDQLAHILVIILISIGYGNFAINSLVIFDIKNLLMIAALVTVTSVSNIFIGTFISQWRPHDNEANSLPDAGKYIGMLERLFVFVFILANVWQAVGFLIAAKSVFRFGDLSKSQDRKLTEYILIGTLLSFGTAILVALAYKYILKLL